MVVFGKEKKGLGWPGRGGGVAENPGEESLAGSVYVGVYSIRICIIRP